MDSLQAECGAKRRRVAIENKEHVDSVKIKDRKDSEKRLNHKNPFGANVGVVDVDDLWLKVKKEIKEELERDMRSSNFDDFYQTFWKEVEVKDEVEKDVEDREKSHQTSEVAEPIHAGGKDVQWLKVKKEIKDDMEQNMKSSNFDDVDEVPLEVEVKDEMKNDEEDHDKLPQKPEVAVKKEVRRRLTRKVQVAAWTEGSSSEKNGDDRAKIKMETIAEHEASFASPLADADGHEDGDAYTSTPSEGKSPTQQSTKS